MHPFSSVISLHFEFFVFCHIFYSIFLFSTLFHLFYILFYNPFYFIIFYVFSLFCYLILSHFISFSLYSMFWVYSIIFRIVTSAVSFFSGCFEQPWHKTGLGFQSFSAHRSDTGESSSSCGFPKWLCQKNTKNKNKKKTKLKVKYKR